MTAKPDGLKTLDLQPREPWDELGKKAPEAIAAGLKKLGPCEGSNLDDEGYWKLVERELTFTSDPLVAKIRENYRDVVLFNMKDGFRRAGWLAVDRELTLEILRLRQAREQDPTIVGRSGWKTSSRPYARRSPIPIVRTPGEWKSVLTALSATRAPVSVLPLTFRSTPPPAAQIDGRTRLDTHHDAEYAPSAMTARAPRLELLVVAGDPVGRSRALPNSFGRGRSRRENENPRPEGLGGF